MAWLDLASYQDPALASETLLKMQDYFDSDPNVFVCIAHDPCLLVHLPTFNHEPTLDLNRWKDRARKEKCHWGWLSDLPIDAEDGSMIGTGMRAKPMVEGLWREGKILDAQG